MGDDESLVPLPSFSQQRGDNDLTPAPPSLAGKGAGGLGDLSPSPSPDLTPSPSPTRRGEHGSPFPCREGGWGVRSPSSEGGQGVRSPSSEGGRGVRSPRREGGRGVRWEGGRGVRWEGAEGSGEPHGGPDYGELAALGLRPEDVLDFSASTNAFGPPPGVRAALAACDVTRYPDRNASPLREALAARDGVPPDRVLVGNGAAGLIWALALTWLRAGDTAFVVGPTFGEYAAASRLARADVVEWQGFWLAATCRRFQLPTLHGRFPSPATHRVAKLAQAIAAARPRLIWLCNPNNPTGAYLSAAEVAALLPAAPDALWVLDEAYRPFVADPWPSEPLIEHGNVVLLRSLTKDCALPGVRLGYLLAAADVVARVAARQPPWSVSAAAIACGLAALQDAEHVRRTTAALRAEAGRLADRLRAQGWRVVLGAAHFMLIEVGDAAAVRATLLREHRIQVRNCASFGLPGFIRVAARRPEENDRLIGVMGDLTPGPSPDLTPSPSPTRDLSPSPSPTRRGEPDSPFPAREGGRGVR